MKRWLIFFNILLATLFVSPFVGLPKTVYINEQFSLRSMPTSTVLAQLNIVPNIVEERDLLEINTVNHISKTITIHDIVFDMDAIHYMLYQKEDLGTFIDAWLEVTRSDEELRVMESFVSYLEENSLKYKARFFRFDEETHFTKIASEFIYDLFMFDHQEVDSVFLINRKVKPYEVRFYEDFDEMNMVAGIYGLYHVYERNTYYLESDVCAEFNLYTKLNEEEKNELIAQLNEDDFVEEEECFFYYYEKLDHDLSFEIIEESIYPHEKNIVFDYQSHTTKPYARFRVVFDYFYEEKLLISSETMNFKISKEASHYRNQHNVELVDTYGTTRKISVDMMYPHRTLVENKELWFYTRTNYFHQMLDGNQKNVKYRKDLVYYDAYENQEMLGGLELIYDSIGYVVYDPLTTFTFNYGISDMNHYLKDVYPFLLWGTSRVNREEYSIVERFIWDKDRFTIFQYGHVLEKDALRQYYDTRLKNVIIGSEVPVSLLDEIDLYYRNTR